MDGATAEQSRRGGLFGALAPEGFQDLYDEVVERSKRLVVSVNEYGFDPFGYDREGSIGNAFFGALLYRYYFRVETHGIENLPSTGPVLIVSNHAGNFGWDAAMILSACFLEPEPPRLARGLAEYFLPTMPFMASQMTAIGSVVGTPENCRQLFDRGECVMVFPEGARGAVKPFSKAYQLQRFGLGFMRMALENDVPILPCGVVGAEESNPAIHNSKTLARIVGSPGFPIPATLPIFGLASFFVPLPVKFVLTFGEIQRFEGPHDAEDAEIQPKVDEVKNAIAGLLAKGQKRRTTWFR